MSTRRSYSVPIIKGKEKNKQILVVCAVDAVVACVACVDVVIII